MSPTRRVWHVWPARGWPFLPPEERDFVAHLQACVTGPAAPFDRTNITAILNALRCGVAAPDLLGLLPGVPAQDLLAAYVTLERRRVKAVHAWAELCADPTMTSMAEHGEEAAELMPVPVTRIGSALAMGLREHHIELVVEHLVATVGEHSALIGAVEAKMAHPSTPEVSRTRMAAELHDPVLGGLWSDPYYLPDRVASLSPIRAAGLLQERA